MPTAATSPTPPAAPARHTDSARAARIRELAARGVQIAVQLSADRRDPWDPPHPLVGHVLAVVAATIATASQLDGGRA